ncbi:MAG TPA: AraC family transcriptional regulator [Bacilli bacterium]|nr:AraC family transcriptional regulator [Bacilli bacterium]
MDSSYNHADNMLELQLFSTGKDLQKVLFSSQERELNRHILYYVLDGKADLKIRDKKYPIKKGMLFIMLPKVKMEIINQDSDFETQWISMSGAFIDKVIYDLTINSVDPYYYDKDLSLKTYLIGLGKIYSDLGYLDLRALGIVYYIFGFLFSRREPIEEILDDQGRDLFALKNYIASNINQRITIKDLANEINNTPAYVASLFKKSEGVSPKRYLTKYRMERAKFLLLTGNYRVKQIASMVGYDDQLHFSTEFRKNVGKSPLHFAQEIENI